MNNQNQIGTNYLENYQKKYKYIWFKGDTLSKLVCNKFITGPDYKNLIAT